VIVVDGYIPPLSATKIRELDAARPAVTPAQFQLAAKAWKAFGSDDPTSIASLLREDTSALPYLAAALKRQLEEFPSIENGLSRSEREALTAIEAGHTTPVAAFLEVAKKQESIFLGDMIFYSYLERLSGKNNPLLTWSDGTAVVAPTAENSREFVKRELRLTPLGRDVLAGRKDWQSINTESRWLGGVHIKPGTSGWRWDEGQRILVNGTVARDAAKARPTGVEVKSRKKVSKGAAVRSPKRRTKTTGTKPRRGAAKKKSSQGGAGARARKKK
jgi:hypothetical protein